MDTRDTSELSNRQRRYRPRTKSIDAWHSLTATEERLRSEIRFTQIRRADR